VLDRQEVERRGLERVVFFSDAVFAIAATLLVIDLRLPEGLASLSDSDFNVELGKLLPRVLIYVLSFAMVGLYWLVHWVRFQMIDRIDARLVVLNLILLGAVALIPFPTALIGEHGDRPAAVIIYALTLAAAGILGPVTWIHAARAGLIRDDIPPQLVRLGTLRGISAPAVLLGSLFLLPFVGAGWVEASWLLIFVVQGLVTRRMATFDDAAEDEPTAS
jgi:uncharacterized membrane protein